MNASKMPMALLPPPTQATMTSGRRPRSSWHWRLASWPMTDWNSRTMSGYGCGPSTEPEQVVAVGDRRDPVAHRLVDRILQRAAAAVDLADGRAEKLHAEDVERLPLHVVRAHVDVALEAEERAGRRGGDAVLPRAGLGDDAALAHPLGRAAPVRSRC